MGALPEAFALRHKAVLDGSKLLECGIEPIVGGSSWKVGYVDLSGGKCHSSSVVEFLLMAAAAFFWRVAQADAEQRTTRLEDWGQVIGWQALVWDPQRQWRVHVRRCACWLFFQIFL